MGDDAAGEGDPSYSIYTMSDKMCFLPVLKQMIHARCKMIKFSRSICFSTRPTFLAYSEQIFHLLLHSIATTFL